MKKIGIIGLTAIFMTVISLPAYAHYLSVNVDNYHPRVGEEVTVSLGYGHHFPETEFVKASKIERLYIIEPDGKEVPLEIKARGKDELVSPIKLKLDKSGTYLVVAERKKYFATKTAEGYKFQSKKGLKDVISSSWSEGDAKAIINVGEPSGQAFQKDIGQRFQIIPTNDPGRLKEGDYLNVKIMLDGKPISTKAYATYAGFSDESGVFAYTTGTKKGTARVRMLESGAWLVKVSEKFPYPDAKEADTYSFTSSLTFGIK